MALTMVSGNLSKDEILAPEKDISFPDSVVSFFKGDLGQPKGGFPKQLQKKVLKNEEAISVRPGSIAAPVDLMMARQEVEKKVKRAVSDEEFNSYLMYPKVFEDYTAFRRKKWSR